MARYYAYREENKPKPFELKALEDMASQAREAYWEWVILTPYLDEARAYMDAKYDICTRYGKKGQHVAIEQEDEFVHHLSYFEHGILVHEYCNSRELAQTRISELGIITRITGDPWSRQKTYGMIFHGETTETEVRYTKRLRKPPKP